MPNPSTLWRRLEPDYLETRSGEESTSTVRMQNIPMILGAIERSVKYALVNSGVNPASSNNINLVYVLAVDQPERSWANFAFNNSLLYDSRVDILSQQSVSKSDRELLQSLPVLEFQHPGNGRNALMKYSNHKLINFDFIINEAVRPFKWQVDKSLLEQLVDSGFPEEVVYGNSQLLEFERDLNRVSSTGFITRNPHAIVTDGRGNLLLLKSYDLEMSARMDAAVNYFLSKEMDFIPGAMTPEPMKVGNHFVNILRMQPGSNELPPIEYWLQKLAHLHESGITRLASKGIIVPDARILSGEYIKDYFTGSANGRELNLFDFNMLCHSCNYVNSLPKTSLINRDIKAEHLNGRFLLDHELSGRGHPALDLTALYLAYDVPTAYWIHHTEAYLRHRTNIEDFDRELREIMLALPHAMMHEAAREVFGSCKRKLTPSTISNNRRLAAYLLGNR